MSNDVLIFAEQRNDQLNPVVLQCVSAARELTAKTGGQVVAVVVGSQVDAATAAVAGHVDKVLTISDASLEHYTATRYRTAIKQAVDAVSPRFLLMPASFMGRDVSPRVAIACGAGLATDVVSLELADGNVLKAKRPIYNGKASGTVTFTADRLAIVSIRGNAYPAADAAGGGATEAVAFAPADGDDAIQCSEVAKTGGEVLDVTEADIIVSGGRSLKSEDNFKILYALADKLGAAVGASRAACDAGYQPHSKQVGLTGKTVTPKLYLACGISGAIQHLAGMRGSKVIVAINTDPEAPMCKVADYVINDDLFNVVPALTEAL